MSIARGEGTPVNVTGRSVVISSGWSAPVIVRGALLPLVLLVVVALGVLAFAAAPAFAGALEAPITKPPTLVTGTSAVLNGELNPGASGTVGYYFAYDAGTSCEGAGGLQTLPGGPVTGEGLAVSETVGSLEGSTEYAFCVVATSLGETLQGVSRTFVTAAIAPKVEGESTEGVTPVAATLKAEVNPENQRSTSCVFEYGKVSVSEHEALCSPAEVQGSDDVGVTAPLASLEAATTYKYRVVVGDKSGKTEGAEQVFETLPAEKPLFLFGPLVFEATPYEATFEAVVSAEYQETSCVLVYGTEPLLEHGTETIPCDPADLGDGGGFVEPKATITGLSPGATYYYRMILENATSKRESRPVEGPAVSEPAGELTTSALVKPVIESENGSPLSPSEAKLEANVNPEYQETTCAGFEYSAEKTVVERRAGTKVACNPESLGKGGSGVGVSAAISGLVKSTTYYYRVSEARNATGGDEGAIEAFTTLAPGLPTIEFGGKTGVPPFGVEITGTVHAGYQETKCYLEYTILAESTVAEFKKAEEILTVKKTGTKIPCEPATMNGGETPVKILPKLKPNTCYFYHLVAENNSGRAEDGAIREFPPGPALAPTVEKEQTSEVTALHARLEVQVNPDEQATAVTFEYASESEGGGANLANGTAKQIHVAIPAGHNGGQPVSADLGEDLTPGETYYYRVLAGNETSEAAGEPTEGPTVSFTIPAAPVLTTAPAQNLTTSTATLSGTVDPEGVATSYHYVYINQALYEEELNYAGAGAFREIDSPLNPYTEGASTPEVTITAGQATHAVTPAQPVTLSGLTPGAKYEYALVATSTVCMKSKGSHEFEGSQCLHEKQEGGWVSITTTVISAGESFTVPGAVPAVLGATSVSSITQATATISASIEPGGLSTRWELQLGSTPGELQYQASGHTTSPGSEPLTVSVGSLSAGTTYYYRFLAFNPQTPVNPLTGREEPIQTPEGSFTTAAGPPPPTLATTPPLTIPTTTPTSTVPQEAQGTTLPPPMKLTNAQKLSRALKSCHAKRAKKRAGCEAAAHRKYGKHKKKG